MVESSAAASSLPTPPAELVEDIILSARYGELEEIESFVRTYGIAALASALDERGNGCLHMASANGHNDVLSFLLPQMPAGSLALTNHAGNTPLHWAAMNGHLDTLRLLVPALPKSALFLRNEFGRTPLSEAETNAPPEKEGDGQIENEPPTSGPEPTPAGSSHAECAGYLLTFMELEKAKSVDDDGKQMDSGPEDEQQQRPSSMSQSPQTSGIARGMETLALNGQ